MMVPGVTFMSLRTGYTVSLGWWAGMEETPGLIVWTFPEVERQTYEALVPLLSEAPVQYTTRGGLRVVLARTGGLVLATLREPSPYTGTLEVREMVGALAVTSRSVARDRIALQVALYLADELWLEGAATPEVPV